MIALRRLVSLLFLLLAFTVVSIAQKSVPRPEPQTARQALLEMLNGDEKTISKHLTVEVQQLLARPENRNALTSLGMVGAMRGEAGVEIFPTGPVLLSVNEPDSKGKIEVRLDNDDLSGDQDTLELSVHIFRDGQEQKEDWSFFLSHFTVTMLRQQEIWRLSKIGLGAEFPVGDPEFLKKTFLKSMNSDGATGVGVVVPSGGMVGARVGVPEPHREVVVRTTESADATDLPPSQILFFLAMAEYSFARQHPEVGFTCSLADLTDSKVFGADSQVVTATRQGYKINLTGCQGKPAGSFQITAEPVSAKTSKAYCTDATRNIRFSDDGRGSTCLAAGMPDKSSGAEATEGTIGFDPVSAATKPKD